MTRYIDADALWKELTTRIEDYCEIEDLMGIIESQPAADVRENVRGKWIPHYLNKDTEYQQMWGYNCSVCGEWFVVGNSIPRYKHCPNCGAEMGVEDGRPDCE